MPERALVHDALRRPREGRGLEGGVQSRATPQLAREQDAGGVSAQHHGAEGPGQTLTMSGPKIGGRSG